MTKTTPSDFRPQTSDLRLQTSAFRPQTSAFRPQTSSLTPLIFSLYKRKYREKLVISKYFVIFALKIFKSGKYGFDS